jgi:hypothetical protein
MLIAGNMSRERVSAAIDRFGREAVLREAAKLVTADPAVRRSMGA